MKFNCIKIQTGYLKDKDKKGIKTVTTGHRYSCDDYEVPENIIQIWEELCYNLLESYIEEPKTFDKICKIFGYG